MSFPRINVINLAHRLLNYTLCLFRYHSRTGKIMFSVISVCSRRWEGTGVPCVHYPWCIEPHHTEIPAPARHLTSLYRDPLALSRPPWTCSNLFNLDLTAQGPTASTLPDMGPYCTEIPQARPPRHVQTCSTWISLTVHVTCSNLFIMKHVWLASGRFASH